MTEKEETTKLKHVAIIMDGNGRWANARAHSRIWGHIRGSRIVSDIVQEADDCGVEALTLYAFSTENWSRPITEISVLFNLLKKFLMREKARIMKNKVRFKVIGDLTELPEATRELVEGLELETAEHQGLKLTFAFGYSGREEIIKGFNAFAEKNPGKPLTQDDFSDFLMTSELGDVDLLIRTGGDQRISNFLLWQMAYAELYFTKTKWPEFTNTEFKEILEKVSSRERRFGAIHSLSDLGESQSMGREQKKVLIQQR
jgi:undecaprenyl diphosphate synthase